MADLEARAKACLGSIAQIIDHFRNSASNPLWSGTTENAWTSQGTRVKLWIADLTSLEAESKAYNKKLFDFSGMSAVMKDLEYDIGEVLLVANGVRLPLEQQDVPMAEQASEEVPFPEEFEQLSTEDDEDFYEIAERLNSIVDVIDCLFRATNAHFDRILLLQSAELTQSAEVQRSEQQEAHVEQEKHARPSTKAVRAYLTRNREQQEAHTGDEKFTGQRVYAGRADYAGQHDHQTGSLDFMDAVTTWQELAHEIRGRLGFNQRAPSATITTNEDEYRATLTRLCAKYGERDVDRQLNRFRRQHVPMITFVRTIDDANQQTEREYALEPLIWQLMTCAAEAAFVARKRLRDIIETTRKLNDEIPAAFTQEQLSKFPRERTVQKPLQEFFREYMACYLSMFTEFAIYPSVLSLHQYENRTELAKYYFTSRAQVWDLALTTVEEERARLLRTNSALGSHNYGSPGWSSSHQSAQFRVRYVEHLGSGTYGEVSKVQEVTTKTYYAQKVVQPRDRRDAAALQTFEKQVRNEVDIMQKLRHDHIASIVFCGWEGNAFRILMQPVADCNLQVYLDDCARQNYPSASLRPLDAWFGCLISALAYAHDKSVKHGNIKPSNILIKDFAPFLSGFGSARESSEIDAGSMSPDQMVAGTPVYRCPESTPRGRKADVFSMGCVFSEMFTVRQQRSLDDYRRARRVDGTDNPNAFRGNLRATNDWLEKLPGIQERYPVQALLLEMIQQMLEKNPEERLDARTVKRRFRAEEELLFCHTCS